jgi:type I restriction enzyme S subunit
VVANTDVTQQRAVLGSAAVVPQVAGVGSLLFSHHVFAIRFRSDAEYLREFTYCSLLQPRFRERAEGFATGTTVLGLPREAILGCEVIVPPRQLVERFTEIARGLESRQNVSLGQNRSLSRARDALLPLLLSGSVGESLATPDLSQGRS